jgi:hypothetical protein
MTPVLLAAGLLAGLLAGCGGKSTPGTTGTNNNGNPNSASAVNPSCDLAPASLVNSALGTHVGDPQAQNLTHIVVCRYSPTTGTGAVVVRIQTDMSRTVFDQGRHTSDASNLPTSDLPGFQDVAYTSVLKAGSITTNTVVALKGTVQILVSSPASFEAEEALETQLFAKLT